MAFEAKDYAISDILNKSVFDIPRNQRRYVWKKPHWQDLYEDIVFSITETKPHFVGSIVLESGGKKDGLSYYTIIDGQQRLTTITIVLGGYTSSGRQLFASRIRILRIQQGS